MGSLRNNKRSLKLESLEARTLLASDALPVLMVLADQHDFYYKEYGDNRTSLESAGLDVVVAATTTNPTLPHPNSGQGWTSGEVTPDIALANVDSADYSAIVFVGGWGSSMYQYSFDAGGANFHANPLYNGDAGTKLVVNNLINEFYATDKHVAAICHGVSVLLFSEVGGQSLLAGRQITVPFIGSPAMWYNGVWTGDLAPSVLHDQAVEHGAFPNAVSGQYGNPATAADDVLSSDRIILGENPDSARLFGQVIAQEVLSAVAPQPAVAMDGLNLVVNGTSQDDTIYTWSGGAANKVFVWMNGQQYGPFALPAGGRVVVHAGQGNDAIYATDLHIAATIYGGEGHDRMTGGTANDLLDGGAGVDRIWAGPGNDLVFGGEGNDVLHGREGNDVIVGGAGADWIEGYVGNDILIGGLGADQLNGGGGEDLLIGGATTHDSDRSRWRRCSRCGRRPKLSSTGSRLWETICTGGRRCSTTARRTRSSAGRRRIGSSWPPATARSASKTSTW